MDFYVTLECAGTLTDDQALNIVDNSTGVNINTDHNNHTTEITAHIEADTITEATTDGLAYLTASPTLQAALINNTVTIEQITASRRSPAEKATGLIDTGRIAELLGVSKSQVRHLRNERPDFPPAKVKIGELGLWLEADIAEFKTRWGKPGRGRPRKAVSS